MLGPLAGEDPARELAGEANHEVGDVHRFLDFADRPRAQDLADLRGSSVRPQVRLVLGVGADRPDHLPADRGWHAAHVNASTASPITRPRSGRRCRETCAIGCPVVGLFAGDVARSGGSPAPRLHAGVQIKSQTLEQLTRWP